MNSNLAVPYGPKPSPPNDSRLVFYSTQNADLLFTNEREIEIHCQAGVRNVGLTWTLARNMFKKPFAEGRGIAFAPNRFLIKIPASILKPGFFDLRVKLDSGNGEIIDGICGFGFRVDEMPITLSRPADFREFWDDAKNELSKIPLDSRHGEWTAYNNEEINAYNLAHAALPADYDPAGHRTHEVEACKVDFASIRGLRIYGCLAKPKGNGRFPAMLVLPGGGFADRPFPLEHARHGYVSLDIQVHGQQVDIGEHPRIPGYYEDLVFEPKQEYYFHKIYLHCLQAVNYLASRPDVDPSKIVVVGGSQGGRTTVTTAALDSRIAAIVPAIAHFANLPYLKWSQACNSNSEPLDGMDREAAPTLPDDPEGRCLGYYDIMSFAPEIKCPAFFNMGMIDAVSYPSGVYAAYRLTASREKQMIPLPGLAHDWSSEFDRSAWRWLDTVL